MSPIVSILIPAYRAAATLPTALASIALCGVPPDQVEIVLAPDDGVDYATLLPATPGLRCLPPGPIASGAGAARNRALAAARGAWIAFLDADDTWAPGYLSTLLPLAQAAGAAFGRTRVIGAGGAPFSLPCTPGAQLSLEEVGATGASFHPVLARDLARPFRSTLSEDVAHAADLLARLGGAAPLGAAYYELHLSPLSTSAAGDFSARVARDYARYEEEAAQAPLPEAIRARLAALWRTKAALNEAYAAQGRGKSFYAFIRARQGAG